jgi:hypothetical protein
MPDSRPAGVDVKHPLRITALDGYRAYGQRPFSCRLATFSVEIRNGGLTSARDVAFAPNIAAQPIFAASRKQSFAPRVGSTAAEAFFRSRLTRHTSPSRK